MTANTDIQYRGNCQVCGRLQAVVKGNSSKHGYTVKDGWFSGICSGQNAAPMQHDTKVTGEVVAAIRRDCVRLDALAVSYENGEITPESIASRIPNQPPTPWEQCNPGEQARHLKSLVYSTRRRAEIGRRLAGDLEALAAEKFGQPLVEAKKETAPPPVFVGEKRNSESGRILECTSINGPRVHWKCAGADGKTLKGWTGSSAWRRYQKV